ncbi:MAG: hypothetical protein WD850_01320 [Candidatus Spechtbacterales bacterium]
MALPRWEQLREFVSLGSVRQATRSHAILAAAFGVVSLLFLVQLLAVLLGTTAMSVILLLAFLWFVWMVLLALVFVFLEQRLARLVLLVFLLVILLMFGLASPYTFFGALFLSLMLLRGLRKAQEEQAILMIFAPMRLLRKGLFAIFIGLSVFFATAYYAFVVAEATERDVSISQEVFDTAFVPVHGLLEAILPGYERGMSLEEAEGLVLRRIVPADVQQNAGQSLEAISFFGPEERERPLAELTHDKVNELIATMITSYRNAIAPIFILGLFFVLQLLSFPFRWMLLGVALLVIKVLRWYNIVVIEEDTVAKETGVLA